MPQNILLKINNLSLKAELNDSESARDFAGNLPLRMSLSRWGDEYYGDCGIKVKQAPDARVDMEVGEIALWPPGNALCLFFGPTPVSDDHLPKAASEVNPIGKILDDPGVLKKYGDSIHLEITLS
ncbi:MAG: hypothetical protein JW969_07940 [Spirochaetales bacterium]|nr:hypothetical protein [Spirochaetales bacterium]